MPPALMACEYGPMAAGAFGVEMASRRFSHMPGTYAALVTLPDRRQRVQTRSRLMPPLTIARTRCRFGSNRRGLTLCAWLIFRPTTGPFPQTSQRFAITRLLQAGQNAHYTTNLAGGGLGAGALPSGG